MSAERRRNAFARLPSVEALLEMFETQRSVQFRVSGERELLNEARRRIRAAAKQFGRPVETHYVKQTGMLFGLVPLTDEEIEPLKLRWRAP